MIASVLHIFRIEKAVDKDAEEAQFTPRWESGPTMSVTIRLSRDQTNVDDFRHLEPFPCSIKPRFEGAEALGIE